MRFEECNCLYSAVMYTAEVWDSAQLMNEKRSVEVKEGVRAIYGLHPAERPCDILYRDTEFVDPGCAYRCGRQLLARQMSARRGWALDQVHSRAYTGQRSAGRPETGCDGMHSLP